MNKVEYFGRMYPDSVAMLADAGISIEDAYALRRISMTLHRWHELKCGDSNNYQSIVLVRGSRITDPENHQKRFEYADNGKPYLEMHPYSDSKPHYVPIPDRERGALKRLAKIMARYPSFQSYVQGDPRGCALYVLRPNDMPEGSTIDSCYSRGIAVYK